jgi:hypothetical protein
MYQNTEHSILIIRLLQNKNTTGNKGETEQEEENEKAEEKWLFI